MNHEYQQAREVTDLYDQLADAAEKFGTLEAQITILETQVRVLRSIVKYSASGLATGEA